MMKISKPVLTNDFLLSPVQFTSLNTILFKNVKNVYDGSEKILLEYEHSSKIEASSRDWIGIFPRGWSTLQQYVTFEWVSQSLPSGGSDPNKENGDTIRRTVTFCPKYHMGSVSSNTFYQFVYISKQIEVLGVSSYFRFDTSSTSDTTLELECLVPVSGKLRSTSVSDIGILMANKISSTTSLDTRTLQTNSIHSLQNLDAEGKSWTKSQIPLGISESKKPASMPRKSAGTGDTLDPYSSHSEPIFPMSFPLNQCKKCFHFKRGGEFLRSQQVLQSKVGPRSEEASELNGQRRTLGREYVSEDKLKIVMERNKVLEERTQEMKKEMERLQTESKKLKTSFYNIYKEKVAYEKFVKDFIKSLEKDSIVRVVNGNTEILVKKVNYVGMEEHPRDKKTSKRERELKAVIGLQEITIRNLINSLQEKAKSVQELNQTVKLAQAFSAARDDSREYGSDVEETLDEVSNSDATSEYEFSLTKPQPPEEVTVEDTDAVLDDIRRATEMELKDIGISRSLGKISSRDSDSDVGIPNLSVRSYQAQSEGIRPKKPRLFDNVDDCWPFVENAPKVVQRKVIENAPNLESKENVEPDEFGTGGSAPVEPDEGAPVEDATTESDGPEVVEAEPSEATNSETEAEPINCESYYDACEALNSSHGSKQVMDTQEEGQSGNPDKQEFPSIQEKSEEDKKEKKNFLMTAIIPHDLNMKPTRAVEEWLKGDKTDSEEKKAEVSTPEKQKKFTCQLSIDFAAKVLQPGKEKADGNQKAIEGGNPEEVENQASDSNALLVSESPVQMTEDSLSPNEKPVLSFKQSNKCLEIQITQVDQKENTNKSYLHQKMVVKFGKDNQPQTETSKPSKFEFNLAVTGLGDNTKVIRAEQQEPQDTSLTLRAPPDDTHTVADTDASPRTIWNDAADDIPEDAVSTAESVVDEPVLQESEPSVKEDKDSEEELEERREECVTGDMNLYQDSLRYEKNLEFLQQKTEEKKDEDVSKDKPTAILIQNGQTKLALIRYQ